MKDYRESERRDAALYLQGRPACDCGHCIDCVLRRELGEVAPKNQIFKGEFQMSTNNQNIAEMFTSGQSYLAEWNRDANLRQEFEGDFEAYCHYQAAYSNGQVRHCGGGIK